MAGADQGSRRNEALMSSAAMSPLGPKADIRQRVGRWDRKQAPAFNCAARRMEDRLQHQPTALEPQWATPTEFAARPSEGHNRNRFSL